MVFIANTNFWGTYIREITLNYTRNWVSSAGGGMEWETMGKRLSTPKKGHKKILSQKGQYKGRYSQNKFLGSLYKGNYLKLH